MTVATVNLAPPPATTTTEAHADWLELVALGEGDRQASIEDLISALRTTSSTEELPEERLVDRGSEQAQSIAESAMSLAEERGRAVGKRENYPFTFRGQAIEAIRTAARSTYTYLLLLSKYGEAAGPTDINGASLFEDVAAVAAKNYLGGDRTGAEIYNFGFPRRVAPSGFNAAVENLCSKLGEGVGPRNRPTTSSQKDAKLDLIAWVPMPDARSGKVIGFGQCATGGNWKEKVSELQSTAWCKLWLLDPLPVDPVRFFFVPHRINGSEWDQHAINAGVIFDRCRLAAHAGVLDRELRDRVTAWSSHVINERLR
jgi:hypothetical protein